MPENNKNQGTQNPNMNNQPGQTQPGQAPGQRGGDIPVQPGGGNYGNTQQGQNPQGKGDVTGRGGAGQLERGTGPEAQDTEQPGSIKKGQPQTGEKC